MNVRKRTKWEPAALMVLVLGLGLWIAFGPASKPKFPVAPDAFTQEGRLGNTRQALEAFKSPGSQEHSFRLWIKDGPPNPRVLTRSEATELFGKAIVRKRSTGERTGSFARGPSRP